MKRADTSDNNAAWGFFNTPTNVHSSLAVHKLLLVEITGRGKLKRELLSRIVEKQLLAIQICLGLGEKKASIYQTHVANQQAKRKGWFCVDGDRETEELAIGERKLPEEFIAERGAVHYGVRVASGLGGS